MIKYQGKESNNTIKKQLVQSFIYSFVINFIIYIYIPVETFFPNYKDYNYPYWLLLKSVLVTAIFNIIILTVLTGFLNEKFYAPVRAFLAGLLVAIYCQYMFMNKSVGILNGSPYNLSNHILEASFNTLFWLFITICPIILAVKKKSAMIKASNAIIYALGALHLLSYFAIILTADNQCFRYANNYYDFSEQFVVGQENNVVVLIIDAADNKYMKELLENNDPILEEFKDFNIYTNTCSVYDYTNHSQLQMVTNFPFDNTCEDVERREIAWNTPWAKEYYNRLHEAGYKVNFYNFDNETSDYVVGKIDNARSVKDNDISIQYINYKMIKAKNSEITRFKLYPIILKKSVSFKNNSKTADSEITYSVGKGCYDNEEFNNNLSLSLGDNDKYIVYNHIWGVHNPDDNTETYKKCLEIMAKYVSELKRLGVYDNTTIIITADHGYIEHTENELVPATPTFMIKHVGETHDSAIITEAPICHSDMMATILYNTNLYNGDFSKNEELTSASVADGLNSIEELIPGATKDTFSEDANYADINLTDEQLFGYPIEYYSEGDKRTRQWFDRWYDPNYTHVGRYTVYCGFKYEGNTKDLEKMVNEQDMEEYQLPMKYE